MKTITVINLGHSSWGECPMCDQEAFLDQSVGWYEEAVQEDIGTVLSHGGEVGGMPVCKECHDSHYQIT